MNNFEAGFIKAAMTKGYTQPEAEAICKEAIINHHPKRGVYDPKMAGYPKLLHDKKHPPFEIVDKPTMGIKGEFGKFVDDVLDPINYMKKVKDYKPPLSGRILNHVLKHKLPYGIGAGVGLAAAGAGAYALHHNKEEQEKTAARGDFAPKAIREVLSNPSASVIAHSSPSPRSMVGGEQHMVESLHEGASKLLGSLQAYKKKGVPFYKGPSSKFDGRIVKQLRGITRSFRN